MEETLRRHATRPQAAGFGAGDMLSGQYNGQRGIAR